MSAHPERVSDSSMKRRAGIGNIKTAAGVDERGRLEIGYCMCAVHATKRLWNICETGKCSKERDCDGGQIKFVERSLVTVVVRVFQLLVSDGSLVFNHQKQLASISRPSLSALSPDPEILVNE